MPSSPQRPATVPNQQKMLFLASHGLQTPLSAIRWGCGRLQRMEGAMPKEQAALVQGIQEQAKLLSEMFDTLLLLAKLEEGAYIPHFQDIYLRDFFLSPSRGRDVPQNIPLKIDCPDDLRLRIDRVIFEAIMQGLFIVVSMARKEKGPLQISVASSEGPATFRITMAAPLELCLVEDAETSNKEECSRQIVGGVPGLMLAVAASLCANIDGTLEVDENSGIVITLPTRESVSVLPER